MNRLCMLTGLAALATGIWLPLTSGAGVALAAQPHAVRPPGALYTVAFRSAQRGWLGGAHTILATTDGGHTWTRHYAGTTTIRQFSFVSDSDGWAMGQGQLLRTTDGGQHWVVSHKPPHALQQIAFVTSSLGWAIAGNRPWLQLLYRTTDGGRHWTRQSLPMPVGAVCFSDAMHGWAARSFATGKVSITLMRTSSGGASWQRVTSPPAVGGIDGFEAQTLRCPGSGTIWDLVDFGGYAGGVAYALYRGDGAGAHWQAVAQVMAPGNQSAPMGPGTAVSALAAPSSQVAYLAGTCFACGGRGTTSVGETLSGGKGWRNVDIPSLPATMATALAFPTDRTGWLIAVWQTSSAQVQSAVYHTTDAGSTWQRQTPAPR